MQYKLVIFALTMALISGCSSNAGIAVNEYERSASAEERMLSDAYSGEIPQESAVIYMPDESSSRGRAEAAGESFANYSTISFTPMTNTITSEDGTTILYESYDSMEFYAQDLEIDSWGDSQISQIEETFHNNSSQLLQQAETHFKDYRETFYSYSNYLSMDVARHDDRLISILGVNSVYSGGAHPVTTQTAYNLDFSEKEKLRLEDVIESDAANTLRDMVVESLETRFKQIGNRILYDNYTETVEGQLKYGNMTPNWYLSSDGLVIYFNQYEIAAYAAGVIKVEFPYGQLDGILKDVYVPKSTEGECGDLTIQGDPADYMITPVQLGTGSRLLIGTECEIYQVQISEVTQVEGTPISRRVILSMNQMSPEQLLEIIGLNQTDTTKFFTIEFMDNAAHQVTYRIQEGKLIKNP